MSCCPCLLYDLKCLQDYGNFVPSIKEDQLRPYILVAIETDIIPVIGQACYDALCAARESVEGFTQIEAEFYRRLQPYIAFSVRWQYLSDPGETYPVGYVMETGPHFSRPERKDQQAAIERADRYRDFYRGELVKWLDAQPAGTFPCWDVEPTGCKPKRSGNDSNSIKITSW